MTHEEMECVFEGLAVDDLAALEGEVDVQGPWDCRYVFDLKVEVDGKSVGVHGELVLDDDDQTVAEVVCLDAYDLSGLGEDADVEDGVELAEEECESVYDRLAELLS